jgi:hypothetical protein
MEKAAVKGIGPKVLGELVAGVQSSEDFKDLLQQLNKGLLEAGQKKPKREEKKTREKMSFLSLLEER